MIPRGLTLWKIVWIVHVLCEGYVSAEVLLNRTDQRIENRTVDTVSGVKLLMNQTNASISSKDHATLKGNEIQVKTTNEGDKDGDSDTKRQPLKRIGSFIMMLPFAMQLLSLPGAIASIKMSLLRSIFVAKLALVILLINALLHGRQSEVVVVHQAQHHQHHYYEPYQHPEEENNSIWSWWGR